MRFLRRLLASLPSLCLPLAFTAQAVATTSDTSQDVLNVAVQQELYRDKTWLKLLHLTDLSGETSPSSIITPEFFLSSNDTEAINPKKELIATIEALLATADTPSEPHAQCRFPARYLWLREALKIPQDRFPTIHCVEFSQWARLDELTSVSLIMVSGYFGNPASTFGHVLIKIQHGEHGASGNLLDQGVNFGATIPPKEPALVYIAKGLFGGYVAGFSDKEFYSQDLIYSKTENRDMWEYRLKLSDYERKLIVSHIWELKQAKYTYYFLKENCAYRVAELFELNDDKPWVNQSLPWALPANLFHRMDDLNRQRNGELIESITFLPSSQRQLYTRFNHLSPAEQSNVNAIIEAPQNLTESKPRQYSLETLNTLLAYYQYKIAAAKDEPNPEHIKARNLVLRARLAQPPKPTKLPDEAQRPVSQGAKPGLLELGLFRAEHEQTKGHLRAAAIHYDPIGRYAGGLEQSELRVLDLSASIDHKGRGELQQLDLVSVKKLETERSGIIGEASYSWEVSTGFKTTASGCEDCLSFYARTAIGKAFKASVDTKIYAMLGGEYQAKTDTLLAIPQAGVIYNPAGGNIAASLDIESRTDTRTGKDTWSASLKGRYSLGQQRELRLEVRQQGETQGLLSYRWLW